MQQLQLLPGNSQDEVQSWIETTITIEGMRIGWWMRAVRLILIVGSWSEEFVVGRLIVLTSCMPGTGSMRCIEVECVCPVAQWVTKAFPSVQ
jgi:hypothetical protein